MCRLNGGESGGGGAKIIIVQNGGEAVRTTVAGKALFVMAAIARQNFAGAAERTAAVTTAYCALAGLIRPSAADRKLITRELAR
jgi:hypothetical protein